MVNPDILKELGPQKLTTLLKAAVIEERSSIADVLALLGEYDRRRLYLEEAYPSLYAYCTDALKYSEQAAYLRMRSARAARRFPEALVYLKEGELSLSTLALLAPHLEDNNGAELLEKSKGKSRLDIERMLAELGPRPAPRDFIRVEGVWAPAAEAPSGAPAPLRVRIAFSAEEALVRDIERAKQVLFHKYPAGGLSEIFSDALGILLNKADPDRRMELKQGRSARAVSAGARRIPQAVKDEVYRRDEGRCRYVARSGERCKEKTGLEFDHVVPFALGGRSDTAQNVRLLCRAHNGSEGKAAFEEGSGLSQSP